MSASAVDHLPSGWIDADCNDDCGRWVLVRQGQEGVPGPGVLQHLTSTAQVQVLVMVFRYKFLFRRGEKGVLVGSRF